MAVRLTMMLFPFAVGWDIKAFLWAGGQINKGLDLYWGLGTREYFAFLPTFGMITAALLKLNFLPAFISIKLAAVFFDSLMALLIATACRDIKKGIVYALSPVSLICAVSGQFDAIPLFFAVTALYLASRKSLSLGSLMLGTAIAFKPWPVIFAPLMLLRVKAWRPRIKFLTIMALMPLAVIVSYKILIPDADLATMVGSIVLYESAFGWWGPSVLFKYLALLSGHRKILTLPVFLSKLLSLAILIRIYAVYKYKNIFWSAQLVIFILYIFSFGLSIHYFVWILPFLLVNKNKLVPEFFLATGIFTVLNAAYIFDYRYLPPALPVWLKDTAAVFLWGFMVLWGLKNYRIQKLLNSIITFRAF
ncbi:MAG: hypothetical protein UV73_C0003G0048 [Candidatus Gottesmanbacteria bacterium GW2011_GWA2_43_14]|uniref:DUF2029 domain-containing protein n=1 Tax=Candidatus Gottesmanbacteria bacterium GW2011_GWA2_43_14 TaxID=1618443 RepID=A0A0G1FSY1_9BACT|nr:MAG: hypothetical protein UV73_C0003G0048 [Candidatus Gottesmanbacteria bacterium GW2011_GWA2_43_14]